MKLKTQEVICIHKELVPWLKEQTKLAGAKTISEHVNSILRRLKTFGEIKR